MQTPLSEVWDLERFFVGGSASPAFARHMDRLETETTDLKRRVEQLKQPTTREEAHDWAALFKSIEDFSSRAAQADAFLSCLTAQDVNDSRAKLLLGRIGQIFAQFEAVLALLDRKNLDMADDTWNELASHADISPIVFALNERRRLAKARLSPDKEALASDLAVDGYHAWGQLYEAVVGRMTIPFEEDGQTVHLSVGQASNRFSDANRHVRTRLFSNYEAAWAEEAELCAGALNHLAGFRLNLYRHRGWDSILKEPLDVNRMTQPTLDAMWEAVESGKDRLKAYLKGKAKLLGLDGLSWSDLDAPIAASTKRVRYEEAADFIVDHFRRFSPHMADFAAMAFQDHWIEAEDRAGKRPGGFCTNFPLHSESRIFTTFDGSMQNVATLAHELGHAYHNYVMRDLRPFAREFPMNVAETASTFAETLVSDAALKAAQTDEERLSLLDERIGRSVALLMNIHARFLFETEFYEARKKGPVGVEQLGELMVTAQKTAYRDALVEYHPYFWASKLHFYITDVPFYNFPYTFGYLFSTGVYARARDEGTAFAGKYVDLLRDTGRMTAEELARTHLGVDLTRPQFWQEAVSMAVTDVDSFLKMID